MPHETAGWAVQQNYHYQGEMRDFKGQLTRWTSLLTNTASGNGAIQIPARTVFTRFVRFCSLFLRFMKIELVSSLVFFVENERAGCRINLSAFRLIEN